MSWATALLWAWDCVTTAFLPLYYNSASVNWECEWVSLLCGVPCPSLKHEECQNPFSFFPFFVTWLGIQFFSEGSWEKPMQNCWISSHHPLFTSFRRPQNKNRKIKKIEQFSDALLYQKWFFPPTCLSSPCLTAQCTWLSVLMATSTPVAVGLTHGG